MNRWPMNGVSPMSYPGMKGGIYQTNGLEHDPEGGPNASFLMHEKMNESEKAREAWTQFLDAAPDDKRAPAVKKKLGAKPAPASRPK